MDNDLEVVVDDRLPAHALYVTVDGDLIRVTVSPRVEAGVLSALRPDIGLAVARRR
jgi:hypothetical protein